MAEQNAKIIERVAHQLRLAQDRQDTPLWQRLRAATVRAGLLSSVGAAGLAEFHKGSAPASTMPQGVGRLQDIVYNPAPFLHRIRKVIEDFEDDLDFEAGSGMNKSYALMSTDEKNHVIRTVFVGWHSKLLANTYPELGSQRTIERVRRDTPTNKGGPQRPVDGTAAKEAA